MPRHADEVRVVELDHAHHLFITAQPDAYRDGVFDQMAKVLHFFEGLLRSFRFRFAQASSASLSQIPVDLHWLPHNSRCAC